MGLENQNVFDHGLALTTDTDFLHGKRAERLPQSTLHLYSSVLDQFGKKKAFGVCPSITWLLPERPGHDERHLFKATILPPPKEKRTRKSPAEQMYASRPLEEESGGIPPVYRTLALLFLAIVGAAFAVWSFSGRRRSRRRQSFAGLAQL